MTTVTGARVTSGRYGVVVGDVRPCVRRRYYRERTEPLGRRAVVMTKNTHAKREDRNYKWTCKDTDCFSSICFVEPWTLYHIIFYTLSRFFLTFFRFYTIYRRFIIIHQCHMLMNWLQQYEYDPTDLVTCMKI